MSMYIEISQFYSVNFFSEVSIPDPQCAEIDTCTMWGKTFLKTANFSKTKKIWIQDSSGSFHTCHQQLNKISWPSKIPAIWPNTSTWGSWDDFKHKSSADLFDLVELHWTCGMVVPVIGPTAQLWETGRSCYLFASFQLSITLRWHISWTN